NAAAFGTLAACRLADSFRLNFSGLNKIGLRILSSLARKCGKLLWLQKLRPGIGIFGGPLRRENPHQSCCAFIVGKRFCGMLVEPGFTGCGLKPDRRPMGLRTPEGSGASFNR